MIPRKESEEQNVFGIVIWSQNLFLFFWFLGHRTHWERAKNSNNRSAETKLFLKEPKCDGTGSLATVPKSPNDALRREGVTTSISEEM